MRCARRGLCVVRGTSVANVGVMARAAESAWVDAVVPIRGEDADYDQLVARVADARIVLLGEPTHGTHEVYRERARITKRLLREEDYGGLAIEGDWPDARRVHRFVTGRSPDGSADGALSGFQRFPNWMWRNADVLAFVEWLAVSDRQRREAPAGFFGLDLYSLHASIAAVLEHLERVDPDEAERARERYRCFDAFGEDFAQYGRVAMSAFGSSCEDEVARELVELRARALEWAERDGPALEEELFDLAQNARLVKNAEEYYRTMYRGGVSSWNLRDEHMAETLDAILAHLARRTPAPKLVVWAHNSHIGDARATEMGEHGELNLGQLVRERYGDEAALVGFTTYEGTVTAATNWGRPAHRRHVRPARPDSYEALFHEAPFDSFYLFTGDDRVRPIADTPRLERAIGVIYRPESERHSHYFRARLAEQFDAVIHVDRSHAVRPLEPTPEWHAGEPPETYPFAL